MKTVIAILNRSLPLPPDFELSIVNPPHSPLTVAGVGVGPRGAPAIAVWQHRQRGTKMLREPEMRFEVELHAGEVAELYPYAWSSEFAELNEQAVTCEGLEPDGRRIVRVDAHMAFDQRQFALEWDQRLAVQGFDRAYYRAVLLAPPPHHAHA